MAWQNPSNRRLHGVLMTCGIVAMVLSVPAISNACCFLDRLFGCGRPTYCAPAAAPACAPCAPACAPCGQTCGYVPSYQTYYRPVPVVTYRPVTACDPCSGCCTTSYMPSRAWGYQACLLPTTTYRVAYSPCATTCAPCGGYTGCATGCSPCGTGGCGVATYGASTGCSSCSVPTAGPMAPVPSAADMSAPAMGTPGTVVPGTTTAPSGPTYEGGAPGPAPKVTPAPAAPGASGTSTEGSLGRGISSDRVVPRAVVPSVPAGDRGLRSNITIPTQPPETPNRTTMRSVRTAAYHQDIPMANAARAARPGYNPEGLDDSGWRQARD
jgi:hypothetical protein